MAQIVRRDFRGYVYSFKGQLTLADTQKRIDFSIVFLHIRCFSWKIQRIWYTFPQIKGLTVNTVTEFYVLQNIKQTQAFLTHPILYLV
ncbi:MAG: DUF1810 domain-containing protein [Ruminococcus sp.]|nr:DUF1810 domain-containing protein [Ruminococcus sp.]